MTWSVALISPVVDTGLVAVENFIAPLRSSRCAIENYFLQNGPSSIETKADEEACLPDLYRVAAELDAKGFDAIIINCMCDPGVDTLQATLSTPVLGPAKTAMHAAAALGRRFAFLDVVADARDDMFEIAARYGVAPAMVSHRAIDAHVLDLQNDAEHTLNALEAQSILAVEEDRAQAVLLGCTLLADFAQPLSQRLVRRGLNVSVIEPVAVTVHAACALLDAGAMRGGR